MKNKVHTTASSSSLKAGDSTRLFFFGEPFGDWNIDLVGEAGGLGLIEGDLFLGLVA